MMEIKKRKKFVKPTIREIQDYCTERKNGIDPEKFFYYYESKGWVVGKSPMKDWKAAVITWEKNSFDNGSQPVDQKDLCPICNYKTYDKTKYDRCYVCRYDQDKEAR